MNTGGESGGAGASGHLVCFLEAAYRSTAVWGRLASCLVTFSQRTAHSRVRKVNPDAQIVTQSGVAVADLKVGDQVQVQGVPTGITVSSLTVGSAPVGLPGTGGFGPGGPGSTAATPSFATARGTVKALPTEADSHLMISLARTYNSP